MGPINYSLGGPDPSQMLLQGLGTGLQINQMQQARAQAEAQAQTQQRMNAELEAASRDPRMIPGLMVRYPQLAEKFKVGLDAMTADQQRGVLSNNTEVASALAANKPEFAIQMVERRANMLREQGDNKGADALGQMVADIKADPEAVLSFTLGRINALPGGDKVSEGILKLFDERRKAAKAPAELRTAEAAAREGEAKATTEEVRAKYADSQALKDLELKGWNIEGIKSDIAFKRESNRIAAMNAAYNREGNDLRREELRMKLDEARRARESAVREKAADLDSARTTTDTLLNTVERLLKTPPSTVRAALGPIDSRLPTIQQDVADFEETLGTLGSQIFLSNAEKMRGLGSLTQAEGTRLEVALGSLSQRQSPESFNANMAEIRRLTLKARKNLSERYGVPDTAPDTPAAPGSRPPLDSFFK